MPSVNKEIKQLSGEKFWRSLDQLADKPEFRRFLEAEFPASVDEEKHGVSRRNFLSIMGASLAMAGLVGCRRPVEKIIPYVSQPESIIPGVPNYYATTFPFGRTPLGVIVESHEGRPTKIEGNKAHPSTRGKSNGFMQAEILNLYDPDRTTEVLHQGEKSDKAKFTTFWNEQLAELREVSGKGLAVVIEPHCSPTLANLGQDLKRLMPEGLYIGYNPISDDAARAGSDEQPTHQFDKAKIILSLDSDFLGTEDDNLISTRQFADGRRVLNPGDEMSRLYVVEPDFSITGVSSDHRLRLPRSAVEKFTVALISELENQGLGSFEIAMGSHNFDRKWLSTLASDLIKNKGASLVVAGRTQPAEVHVLVKKLNSALDNVGKTVAYLPISPSETDIDFTNSLHELDEAVKANDITTLVMLGGNPVYNAPTNLNFQKLLKKVTHTVHLSDRLNETSQLVDWHLPRAHWLESWGDAATSDGVKSVIQPLIEPLFGGIGDVEFLNLIVTGENRPGHEIVRESWQKFITGDFETGWRKVLHDGLLASDQSTLRDTQQTANFNRAERTISYPDAVEISAHKLELIFQVSPTLYDGRYANNGWMQELPHPVSKLTWDNAAAVSTTTANDLGVTNGDVVALTHNGKSLELPIWIVPGLADNMISLELGYGQKSSGRVANNVGVNAYAMRTDENCYALSGVTLTKTGNTYPLASTQDHGSMEGRPIVRQATRDHYVAHPAFAQEMAEHPPLRGIYPEHDYSKGYQWGMAIDLSSCTGCNSCTVACQSENNISVVGKEQVANGREMHWIRMDRYFTGETENPTAVFQPVTCQHCENAPCEQVCPVQATSHDKEGLNVMTYNRCVGTRYCSNNCPYKVRRFNYFNFVKDTPEIVKLAMNPDVTMRSRGVMEKCTFCTQRINQARISAKKSDVPIADGQVTTACEQACPADAITFGNINDPDSRVVKVKKQNRNYELLAELNTKPRNSYLAIIKNRHPELEDYIPSLTS